MIKYTQYMIKRHVGRTPAAILAAMIILSLVGAVGDLRRELAQRSERPVAALTLVTQAPHYTGSRECLTEGVPLAQECNERGELPVCLAEDGSGPGVWCFWTDPDTLTIWFNDGHEGNDQDVS